MSSFRDKYRTVEPTATETLTIEHGVNGCSCSRTESVGMLQVMPEQFCTYTRPYRVQNPKFNPEPGVNISKCLVDLLQW
ncbi:hypothetical protein COCC4DRAFT_31639 [Bipolaris maydis ATCC 48331]|uniref:Uncharacterized protein n=2 Tax=Cochliobolus heterostrophus TaxID=5016 RepID=M2TIX8_COCH5|nr:uncharacterized protein COCC4DRAFT_31639 [Bipolaris maydis ATCC 48331]EMD86464.1 hypothetical protein COCHEDRAFT_1024096 [Bipolaris maydis C5]ENI06413.1 hypothetical protein COCC4DRAFT_31639 [Bipolaris maydis ATCC 48331]